MFLSGGGMARNAAAAVEQPTSVWTKTTRDGHFRVTAASQLTPPRINRMHGWTVTVTAPDGTPVTDARFTIDGGVPDIGRTLPTAPRMTRNLGGGRYLIGGVRFNMVGRWRLNLAIESGHLRDRVSFGIDVE